jgi:hypothetical protein
MQTLMMALLHGPLSPASSAVLLQAALAATEGDSGARERVQSALVASLCECAAQMQLGAVFSGAVNAATGASAVHVTQTVVRRHRLVACDAVDAATLTWQLTPVLGAGSRRMRAGREGRRWCG